MLVSEAADKLAQAGVDSALWDARLLAAHALGTGHMSVRPDSTFPPAAQEALERRMQREPLQHILGSAPFGPMDLKVGPGVFIPRPETEVLADWGVRALGDKPVVVDLCAGSGALGLYVAQAAPSTSVTLVEKSPAALEYLRDNAFRYGEHNTKIVQGDATDPSILADAHARVDLLLSNPPYVPTTAEVSEEVHADPAEAVFGGVDGMSVITAMVETMATLLADDAHLGLEHDESTAEAVRTLLAEDGRFYDITTMHDLSARPRFCLARRRAR